MTKKPTTELTVAQSNLPAHLRADQNALAGEFMASTDPKLPIIKVAPGGINKFQKDDNLISELNCIIIGTAKINAMWMPKEDAPTQRFWSLFDVQPDFDDDAKFPICSSVGAMKGSFPRLMLTNGFGAFGACHDCYFSQFRSDLKGGRGKACRSGRR